MFFLIGSKIREERKRRKITQEKLACVCGMGRATISQIENGTIPEIGVRKLIRILESLDLELFVRKANAPPTLDELKEGFFDEP
ncbi:MAG: helix-turn-helix transcriptional regulator [Thermodesulfobacteriota bacterium]|nr:helix-turn-helix transcriptional regulator [Thermodesulfobacteriota bacterium]